MKAVVLFFALVALALPARAQQWADSFADAQQTAKAEHKSVVLVFSGSDWCAPCIKLDREVWQDAGFQADAAADFVFYRADFPRKKENKLPAELAEANGALAERYNTRGAFPLVVVLNPDGEVLGQAGYEKIGPDAYLAKLESFTR